MQMSRSLDNPRDTVRKICTGGKILALTIFIGALLVISAVTVFAESPDFTKVMLFGIEIDLSFIPYVGEILKTATNIAFAFGLISLLPMALIAVGLMMARFGSGDKPMLIGLHLVKTAFWLFALSELVSMCCYIFPLITIAMAVDVMIAVPLYIVILIIAAYFSLRSMYFSNFSGMVGSAADTYRFGVNLTVSSGYVTFISWAFAIINVLMSLSAGPASILSSVALGVSLILATLCFGEYKRLHGTVKAKKKNEMLVSVASDPNNKGEISEMGVTVNENGKLITTGFVKYTFGTYVLGIREGKPDNYQTVATPARVAESQPQAYVVPNPGPRFYNHEKSSYTPSPLTYSRAPEPAPVVEPKPAPAPAPTPFVREEPKQEVSAPRALELKGSPLKLFGSDMEELAENYKIIGKKQYRDEISAPLTPTAAVVVFDSFSENKLLRMAWKNKSGYGITSVNFDLTFRDSCGRTIAKADGVRFTSSSEITPGEIAFAELGLPVPDDTCSGGVTVTRVEFSNGLFWSKTVEAVSFEAEVSKRVYELKNASLDKVLVSCIELDKLNFNQSTHTLEFAVKNIGDAALVSYELLIRARSESYLESLPRVSQENIRIMPGEVGELHRLTLSTRAVGGAVEVLSGVYENNAMETNLAKFNFGVR